MSTPPQPPISENLTSYDEMPYPAAAFAQTHPNRLGAMGRLFGLLATDPTEARVLELGCADGSNLLPMAEQAPKSRFLGIDTSRVQVGAGEKAIAAAGLENVELRVQDILDFPASEGKFDYIIAHGVYSWVPDRVRQKMLAICQEHLAPNGIAYISYNALPGWNMRRSLRDMMMFHTRTIPDPKVKVQQARALLKFLAESVPTDKSAYGMMLKSELETFSNASDNYFRHDILEEENTAFYFHDFCARAEKNGLQYLSESNLSEMLASNFPENVSKTLLQVGDHIIAQEQYMDFVRNRLFRQTLLCRNGVRLNRNVSPESVRNLAFQSRLKVRLDPVDLNPDVAVSFEAQNGQKITTTDSFLKAVLATLAETSARALSYVELFEAARERVGRPEIIPGGLEDATLAANVFRLYLTGFVEIFVHPVAVALTPPKKPMLTRLMRHQAFNSQYVTNRVHGALPADGVVRNIMGLCDGTRTEEQITDALAELAISGALQVNDAGKRITEMAALQAILSPRTRVALASLTRLGFFARENS